MMDWNDSWGPGAWLTMSAMMLLLWGVLIGAVVFAGALLRRSDRRRFEGDDPGRLLDQRFARGELTEDEYLSAKSMLAAHADPPGSA